MIQHDSQPIGLEALRDLTLAVENVAHALRHLTTVCEQSPEIAQLLGATISDRTNPQTPFSRLRQRIRERPPKSARTTVKSVRRSVKTGTPV